MPALSLKRPISLIVVLLIVFISNIALAETLYVQRVKVDIKKGQGAFYPTVYTAKKGEALQVISESGGWYKVNTPKGSGWVFSKAVAERKPMASLTSFTGTADTSELDKTAGFKGFDAPTEKEYVSKNKLQQQMRIVDKLQRPAFSVSELKNFQKKGKIGSYGGAK